MNKIPESSSKLQHSPKMKTTTTVGHCKQHIQPIHHKTKSELKQWGGGRTGSKTGPNARPREQAVVQTPNRRRRNPIQAKLKEEQTEPVSLLWTEPETKAREGRFCVRFIFVDLDRIRTGFEKLKPDLKRGRKRIFKKTKKIETETSSSPARRL